MKKAKKLAIVFLMLVLPLGGLWFYWEWPMTMSALLPEEEWVRIELRYGDVAALASGMQDVEFESPDLDRLLPQMGAVWLTRAEERHYLDDQYFQIILYKGESYPTMIYVGNTGRIQIARELDFDHWKNYEGGEDFYCYLLNYSQSLPAVFQMSQ